jgi:hypothetical protein
MAGKGGFDHAPSGRVVVVLGWKCPDHVEVVRQNDRRVDTKVEAISTEAHAITQKDNAVCQKPTAPIFKPNGEKVGPSGDASADIS